MRKTLSDLIGQTTDEPKSVAILEALEKEYGRRPAVEVKVTGVEGLVRSLDLASIAEASGSRSERQEIGQTAAAKEGRQQAPQDCVKVANQLREWSFRYDGKQLHGENFKDYMVDMQTLIHTRRRWRE